MKTINKLFSVCMSFVMLLSCLTGLTLPVQAAKINPVSPGTVRLYKSQDQQDIIRHNGSFLNQTMAMVMYDKDGKSYPAYCVQPNLSGVPELRAYDVTADNLVDNAKIYTAIVNGYPFESPTELGVKTDYEAYVITKLAVWSVIEPNYGDLSVYKSVSGKEYVLDAFKKLASKAQEATEIPSLLSDLTGEKTSENKTDSEIIQKYVVKTSDGQNFTGQYEVEIPNNAPIGTTITNINGSEFTINIPISSVPDNTSGSFDLKITTTSGGSAMVYMGDPTQTNRQAYALAYEGEISGSAKVDYSNKAKEEGSGALRILKREAGTLEPLSGATFQLVKLDGTDAGQIGDYKTNEKGEILFSDLTPGAYRVQEIQAPKGYLINTINMKNVTIQAGNQKQQEVTFDNYKTPKLSVKKISTDGTVVPGAVFKISLDGGSESYTGFTDSSGEIIFGNVIDLKPGTYKVEEVSVPAPFILDTTPQYVKLEAGKTASVVFKNAKKSKWRLWKYIKGTTTLLDGAEFTITNLDTNALVWEGVVKGGFMELDGFNPGWYRIAEKGAPFGYVMEWTDEYGNLHKDTYKDIKLEADKDVDVKFDNIQRPEIELRKVDDKGNPVAGAIFQFKKADGETMFEKQTDKDGKIVIEFNDKDIQLTAGVYEVKELQAPDGYVMDKVCSQTVTLNNGERKILTFVNHKKPTLTILKVDEETKEPLSGAKFRITMADGKTIREEITGENGKIFLENLEPGIYSVEEIVAPTGYLLDPQHKDITLAGGDEKQLIYTDRAKPRLRIQKVDAKTGELLKNAEFRVTKVEDKTVSEYILETGEITLNNLEEAIYSAYEFHAPDGYVIVQDTKQIALEAGKTKTLKFDNIRKPVVIFTKTNALTGKGIPGAKFTVEYELSNGGTKNLGSFTTDMNGRIIIPKADPGWYIFTEVQPAQGFSMPKNPVTRKYFEAGENAYLSDFNQYYTAGTGKFASGYSANDGTTENQQDPVVSENTNGVIAQETANITPASTVESHSGSEYATAEGFNWPLNSIVVKKTDANTGVLLEGAAFQLYRADEQVSGVPGTMIGRYTTDNSGIVVITGLEPGYYVVKEVQAPQNYTIDENGLQNGFLKSDGTTVLEFTFKNHPYGSILISKVDALTGKPLPEAKFKVVDSTGAVVGNTNGEYKTDSNGEILIPNVAPGSYMATEIQAPTNYAINTTPQTIKVGTDGKTYKLAFDNYPYGTLLIKKIDATTKAPLSGAEFKVTTVKGEVVGTGNGYFTTDTKGEITIPNLSKGSYIISETKAPTGYVLQQASQTIDVEYGKTYTLEFPNAKQTSLIIKKTDEKSGEPLAGAQFRVEKQNGEFVGEYTTSVDGTINIPTLAPDWYIVRETKAPSGYILNEASKTVQVKTDIPTVVTFTNKLKSGFQIVKIDAKTGTPLPGAIFTVYKKSGEVIGEYTTDKNGVIIVDGLENGWYKLAETKAPEGYMISESPKDIELTGNQFLKITFENKKLTSLQIKKVDAVTGAPLAGAQFTVEKQNGETVYTDENGTIFTTDGQGLITIPTLDPDHYVIREVKSPQGYLIDESPKTVEVKTDSPTVVTFANKPLGGLKIIKLDSETRKPIPNVEFAIAKMSGEKVQNESNGYIFKTDSTGQIYIPGLVDGYYSVTETKAADGYFLDGEPKTVEVKSGTPTFLEVTNKPGAQLLIVKTDAQTGKPLQGVVFDVKRADGQRVQGSLLDGNQPNTENNSPNKTTSPNGDISGSYTTDANGRILINSILPGEYNVVETQQLKGYELDTEVHSVTVTAGKQAVLRLQNKSLSGLRLLKIDAITGEPIYNVEFSVYDSNNKVVGNFYTDDQGIIDFSAVLTEGRYTVRETRPAEGYYPDNTPRTVEFIAGKVTDIIWKNIPNMAQIQITKLSADDNEVNGLEAGTPLQGAIFEVYAYKSGKVMDRFITGNNGVGVSKPLPLGRYLVKEVQAPPYYQLNSKELDVTLEFATQIIKMEYTNKSANTGVAIKKVGNMEAMPGDTIKYDIKNVQNTSTVPLTDFFWRDILPTDAVRINKIVTGTYNQSLKYKILVTTNKGNTMVIADNLSTTQNNVIDCSNASLGLRSDEFVTQFTLYFGQVKAGFKNVDIPQVFVTVLNSLPSGYQFSNKADTGGKYNGAWVIGSSSWLTTLYKATNSKMPKTGY